MRDTRELRTSALYYAILSDLSYNNLDLINQDENVANLKKITLIERKHSQCVVFVGEKSIVFSFRGTESLADVKSDMMFRLIRTRKYGRVHQGFMHELDTLWSAIVPYINQHLNKKIYFCGHSLGGAIALLAATRVPHLLPEVYTYGAPRVGNKVWVIHHRSIIHHRFRNNNDLIPLLPFWFLGYRHHGQLHYISYHGSFKRITQWQRIIDQVRGVFKAWSKFQLFDSIYDHRISEYIRKLSI